MQLDIIEQVIGVRKNISDLAEDEARQVLQEVMGEEKRVNENERE
jgi:hypothetical protein